MVNWHALKRAAAVFDRVHQHSSSSTCFPSQEKKINFKRVSGNDIKRTNLLTKCLSKKLIYASKGTTCYRVGATDMPPKAGRDPVSILFFNRIFRLLHHIQLLMERLCAQLNVWLCVWQCSDNTMTTQWQATSSYVSACVLFCLLFPSLWDRERCWGQRERGREKWEREREREDCVS